VRRGGTAIDFPMLLERRAGENDGKAHLTNPEALLFSDYLTNTFGQQAARHVAYIAASTTREKGLDLDAKTLMVFLNLIDNGARNEDQDPDRDS